ncbi:SDR family oxidoreductase [Limibaculum sp. M0105]|uniref:Enoyl-[acyl-carrier-protein] reductase [NADH] n=1 Tax=Thermohalobaculum xanthum TaxID=2753746 RepID=A0A8J7M8E1_9RHOB|nr:SDR family oxidoreductase [Thermohalobaculum xanthum]MBK0400105.1 SDR family oxidoreductase [Thermohalobaculum xanthum]
MSGLMQGKRGLIMGVANDHSIAWGVAKALHAQGAELAFTYQGHAFERRVRPLAESLGANVVMDADVTSDASLDEVFSALKSQWGSMDFLVHAIAYSDKAELTGRFADTSRANFLRSMDISCYSFVDVARRAADLMPDGGALVTMTYLGAQRVMPNYNVMGVAKAALEASVRYLANDLGPQGIRVNAISPGPMRTLAGSAIGGARRVFRATEDNAPLRKNAALEHVGGAAVYLLSDLGASTSGDVLFVDGGYHVLGMAQLENLPNQTG